MTLYIAWKYVPEAALKAFAQCELPAIVAQAEAEQQRRSDAAKARRAAL